MHQVASVMVMLSNNGAVMYRFATLLRIDADSGASF
jgi:hypothetical protein